MKYLSVCSGIEAASVAWQPLGWEPVAFSEIEPFPRSVLAHHYPNVPNLGDMRGIVRLLLTGEVEAADVLCGGTPRQAFSVAGKRESLADERGNLSLVFVEIADAIDHVRVAGGKQMKERPIILKPEEVRAILDGRKTQARRIVKPQPLEGVKVDSTWIRPFAKGQRLWVRESWAVPHTCDHLPPRLVPETARIHYLATAPLGGLIKRPSIHMPRWASRITLEVVCVRVERLQDISEADAQAEGATGQCPVGNLRIYNEAPLAYHFAQIWEQAHPNTWDQNPWVWVVEFRRVEP